MATLSKSSPGASPGTAPELCALCLEDKQRGFRMACCNGFICGGCSETWKKTWKNDAPACPYCRAEIPHDFEKRKITTMLRVKAERGAALDQFCLAKYLLTNVKTRDAKAGALAWLEKAAAQQFAGAMHALANEKAKEFCLTQNVVLLTEAVELLGGCVGQPGMTDALLVVPLQRFTRKIYVAPEQPHSPLVLKMLRDCKRKKIPVPCANCDSKYCLNIMEHGTPGVDVIGNALAAGTNNWCPCRSVRYCSKKCQKEHWRVHKKCHAYAIKRKQ